MSYPVTGIHTISVDFTFHATDHAGSGVIHSPLSKTTVDHDTTKVAQPDAVQATTPDKPKVALAPHTAAPVDTVTLSFSERVRELRQQGAGETQIAAALNLPLKEVQTDLHVQTKAQHLSFTVAPISAPLSTVAAEIGQAVSADA